MSAKLTLIGVRYDLATGKTRTFSISKVQKSAGPKGSVAKAQRGKVCA